VRSSVFVDPGEQVALDRPSLSAPPPFTADVLLEHCERWAGEVGWALVEDPEHAASLVLGPGVEAPPTEAPVVWTEIPQGIDGFRWAIRHLAFGPQWPYETLTYGLLSDHEIDVRHPRRRRAGVALLLHGGFWMESWRRDLMEGIAIDLAQQGWQTCNVEYGRAGGTGGWPQTGEDVLAALDATLQAAEVDHVTVIGHSAGAQLALWAAAHRPEAVARVVSLAGLCDLEDAHQLRLGGGAVERFLGGAVISEASPLTNLCPTVPVLLVHCEADSVVPVEQSTRYAEAAAAAGGDVELLVVAEGDHMDLIEPARQWPVARDALLAARKAGDERD
jgi:acetyl esterase/lipase